MTFAAECRDVKLETRLRYAGSRLVDRGVGVECVVDEQTLDKIVEHGGDGRFELTRENTLRIEDISLRRSWRYGRPA